MDPLGQENLLAVARGDRARVPFFRVSALALSSGPIDRKVVSILLDCRSFEPDVSAVSRGIEAAMLVATLGSATAASALALWLAPGGGGEAARASVLKRMLFLLRDEPTPVEVAAMRAVLSGLRDAGLEQEADAALATWRLSAPSVKW